MKLYRWLALPGLLCMALLSNSAQALDTSTHKIEPAPNGITLPAGYKDWRVISQSHRTDNNTVRIILGNDIAIKAARNQHTLP